MTISSSVPATRATGPEARVPTKLPAIAAPVHSGNRRFAWRASKTEPATVQEIVPAMVPEAYVTSQITGTTPSTPAAMTTRPLTRSPAEPRRMPARRGVLETRPSAAP